jgi:3-methyladenine DNA glycosylase AlkD
MGFTDKQMKFKDVYDSLKKRYNKNYAAFGKKYMKSDLEFFGISNTVLRSIAKNLYKENRDKLPYTLIKHLWFSKNFEVMYVSLYLLEFYKKIYNERTWNVINRMTDKVENWAHCDHLCKLRSEFWQRKDFLPTLQNWTKSRNLWKRRSAAVSLLVRGPIRIPFTFKKSIQVLDPMLYDEEYFVQKGVGWMLRVLYQQYPIMTFEYLKKHRDAPRVLLRTACKKMTKTEREEVFFKNR